MGIRVEIDIPAAMDVQFDAAVQRGLLEGASEVVLPAAVAGAPEEPVAKHDVHLRETGYARLDGQYRAEVGFTAYWAVWQEEDLDYHHETGHAKFTELALAERGEAALERVAERVRGIGG